MPTTPYTTPSGLQIGRCYIPRQRPAHDRDACRLQDALLFDPQREAALRRELREELWIGALCAVALVATVALLATGGL